MRKKQLAIISLLIIFVIGIPLTLLIFSKRQQIQSRAEKSTTLYFSPASSDSAPLQTQIGDAIPLDVMVNPGTNLVSLVKLEIIYDPAKFEAAGVTLFQPNPAAFSQIIEEPLVTSGKILITLSIGTDPAKSIKQITRAGTLKLKAIKSTTDESTDKSTTPVIYGSNTQVLALGANASATENVLSNTQPAIIIINPASAPICTPRPPCLDTTPKCLVPEPVGGWCMQPTPTLAPTVIPTGQPTKCENASSDTVLIIDRSGSMSGPKFTKAKEAAKIFIDKASSNPDNKISLISFGTNSALVSPLTNNFNNLKTKIDSLTIGGGTCIQCGIKTANTEILTNGRTGYKKVVVLLTDGKANRTDGRFTPTPSAETAAIDEVKNGYTASKTVFYTIGLGPDVSAAFLNQVANLTGGKYFFSPNKTQLNDIYTEIFQAIAKGAISGFVFNDSNNNKQYDQNENKLPGWTINLFTAGSNTLRSFITDEAGTYYADELCDGSYTLKETLKTGWIQTLPTGPDEYVISITNGNVVTDKNFGNYQSTPTSPPITIPPPANTTFLLNGLLDGIGSRGDNSNPDGSLSNKKPLHPLRNVIINIFNASNQFVASTAGTIKYNSSSGSFTGIISTTSPISAGNYNLKIAVSNHLVRLLPGIQNIKTGQANQLPDAILIAGDVVNDNRLNILDYNSLIGCYSDLSPAVACDGPKNIASDLNDDGDVNQFDYNLFLRELATQPGQ